MTRRLISPEYAELNRRLHAEREDYGTRGVDVRVVLKFASMNGFQTILDYGCGKGALKKALAEQAPALTVLEFDPAIEGKDSLPTVQPDLIVAGDVMEHIEPEYLDAVLSTMRDYRPRAVMLVIATRPAIKTLPDGRNAHLIVQPADWWTEKLSKYFRQTHRLDSVGHFTFVGVPH